MKQVVSVKLPPPGQGLAPVNGSTAGSGRSRPAERPTSEMVALDAADSPIRRPEGDGSKLPSSESAAAEVTEPGPALETSGRESDKPFEGMGSSTPAKPDGAEHQLTAESGSATAEAAADGSKPQPPPRDPRAKGGAVRQTPRGHKKEQREQKEAKTGDSKDTQSRPAKQPLSSREPRDRDRRRSAPIPRAPRANSEPPKTAQSDGAVRTPSSIDPRLVRLISEIENHFEQFDSKPPADAMGWLKETAQLELFEEELRWMLKQHEKDEGDKPSADHSPASEAKAEPAERIHVEDVPSEPAPRAEKDLNSALLHLRSCEREHAHLMQLLGYEDAVFREERLMEIRELEEEVEQEQRKVKHMDAENRRRERALARAAALAASSMNPESDGNGRALRQTEQWESESAVWQVKNENLQKQVLQLNIYMKQDLDKQDQLEQKLQALREKLESEEAKQWIEEQRQREEERWNAEQVLSAEVKALQDRRVSDVQATKKAHTEMQRQLVDLRKQQATLEPRLAHLDGLEKQLRRQWKQLARQRRREADNAVVPAGGSEELPSSVLETQSLSPSFGLVAETLAQHVLTTRPAPEASVHSADATVESDNSNTETQKPSPPDPPKEEHVEETGSSPEIGISLDVDAEQMGPPAQTRDMEPGLVSVRQQSEPDGRGSQGYLVRLLQKIINNIHVVLR
ncbi:unnamed protein product [Symbiodinium necroappetens]|uniref:Reticulocyte-binding protein 2-like a n=1 Tax=Symbiodinium necroappetens TaxID=1628268 RepID=A0A812UAH6_9DINO|nr:unnamed protein product [Symbiodinium necroappetens]